MYYHFQIFNIYTANGSVIPLQAGATSQTGVQTSAAAGTGAGGWSGQAWQGGLTTVNATTGAIQGGVSGTSMAGAGESVSASLQMYLQHRYAIAPAGQDPFVFARQNYFLDRRGFARVRK